MAELQGFDVTALTVDEMREHGVVTGRPVEVTVGENEAWKPHSEFLADDRPSWDIMDRSNARARTAAHVRRVTAANGGQAPDHPLRGLRLARSFPCMGMLRRVSARGRMVVVECDGCGESFGVSTPKVPEAEDGPPSRRRRDHADTTPGRW